LAALYSFAYSGERKAPQVPKSRMSKSVKRFCARIPLL